MPLACSVGSRFVSGPGGALELVQQVARARAIGRLTAGVGEAHASRGVQDEVATELIRIAPDAAL